MKKNKTIICFDSWTKGYYNFNILSKPLKKFGYKLLLIHTGSWGHDKGRPKEEYIEKLLVRDISYYNSKSFLDILKLENPKAVLSGATDFMHLFGNFLIGFMWIKMALTSFKTKKENTTSDNFHEGKILKAKFYMQKIAPETKFKLQKLLSGEKTLISLDTKCL